MPRRKKPVFAKRDENDEIKIKEKQDNGGLSKKTKQRRAGALKTFDECQLLNDRPSLKELCEVRDKNGIESDLQGFFQSYYVQDICLDKENLEENDTDDVSNQNEAENQNGLEDQNEAENQNGLDNENDVDMLEENDDKEELVRPKGNTSLAYKSHFKMMILEYTNNEFDITSKTQFPNFFVSIILELHFWILFSEFVCLNWSFVKCFLVLFEDEMKFNEIIIRFISYSQIY